MAIKPETDAGTVVPDNDVFDLDLDLQEFLEADGDEVFDLTSNDEQTGAYCPDVPPEDPDADQIRARIRAERARDRRECGALWTAQKSGAMAGFEQLRLAMGAEQWEEHVSSVRDWLRLELGIDEAKAIHPLLHRALVKGRRGEAEWEAEHRLLRAEEQALLATATAFGSWDPERVERFIQERHNEDLQLLRENIAFFLREE